MAFIHPQALVESKNIGEDTRVWAFTQIMAGSTVGANCNIGSHCFIETGAIIGNRVTVKNQVCLWKGVSVEDDVFIGPNAIFTNDKLPRSPRAAFAAKRYENENTWLKKTVLKQGCSIGAGAVILPGVTIGSYAMVAAGSVVTKSVKDHQLVKGVPAETCGKVCFCGRKVPDNWSPESGCSH